MLLLFWSLLACVNSKPIKSDYALGLILPKCTSGWKCFPPVNYSNIYEQPGCLRFITDIPILPYCIINGNPLPDPQIGYLGPCSNIDICIDCSSNSVCYNGAVEEVHNDGGYFEIIGNLGPVITQISYDHDFMSIQYNRPYEDDQFVTYDSIPFDSCSSLGFDGTSIEAICYTPYALYAAKTLKSAPFCIVPLPGMPHVNNSMNKISGTSLSTGSCEPNTLCMLLNGMLCIAHY
jgi:hypothetical protein